jgi:hypothetical protein
MNRDRAETYLRVLAEAELRHGAWAARVTAGRWSADRTEATLERMGWVALALTSVRALDIETAEAVLADYAAAFRTRPRFDRGRPMLDHAPSLPHGPWRAPWFTWPTCGRQVRPGPAQPTGSRSPGQGRPARLVSLGLTVPYCHDGMDGKLHLLSYSRTAAGAGLVIGGRMPGAGGGHPLPSGLFRVTDDRGACYGLSFTSSGGSDPLGEIRLRPDPPDDVQRFELIPPGGPAVRVDVNPGTPPDDTWPRVCQTGLSAGEHLLNQSAERLLVSDLRFLSGSRQRSGGPASWLGDVVAALEATGTLSPVSPVPGRIAALCARMGVTGHGIAVPPAHDLPEPWLSLLAYYQRRKPDPPPAWDGFAAVAAALPELDGIRLALLGVLSLGRKTVLYLRASSQSGPDGPPDQDIPLSVWVRDSDGRWHAADLDHWSRDGREHVLTLYLVPPLSTFAPWIELRAAGPSSEVRARLPLRWQ